MCSFGRRWHRGWPKSAPAAGSPGDAGPSTSRVETAKGHLVLLIDHAAGGPRQAAQAMVMIFADKFRITITSAASDLERARRTRDAFLQEIVLSETTTPQASGVV